LKAVSELSHIGDDGQARMVNVGEKEATHRAATARSVVRLNAEAAKAVAEGGPKGDVLGTARLAGIQAAKRTAELIPLCHPLGLDHVEVDATLDQAAGTVTITATASLSGKTGVEMEAMTAASVAALTIYDMVKAVQRDVVIEETRLITKTGGKSGDWHFDQ
jgi:cyclic pyranopterin phosphate synthase